MKENNLRSNQDTITWSNLDQTINICLPRIFSRHSNNVDDSWMKMKVLVLLIYSNNVDDSWMKMKNLLVLLRYSNNVDDSWKKMNLLVLLKICLAWTLPANWGPEDIFQMYETDGKYWKDVRDLIATVWRQFELDFFRRMGRCCLKYCICNVEAAWR